jgi:hypothetical protein
MIDPMDPLLPNLGDLIEALPDRRTSDEARELAEAAGAAATLDELDQRLRDVVSGWMQE